MVGVQGLLPTNRHADTMNRKWMIGTNKLERAVGRAAGAQIVFGMDLEEILVLLRRGWRGDVRA